MFYFLIFVNKKALCANFLLDVGNVTAGQKVPVPEQLRETFKFPLQRQTAYWFLSQLYQEWHYKPLTFHTPASLAPLISPTWLTLTLSTKWSLLLSFLFLSVTPANQPPWCNPCFIRGDFISFPVLNLFSWLTWLEENVTQTTSTCSTSGLCAEWQCAHVTLHSHAYMLSLLHWALKVNWMRWQVCVCLWYLMALSDSRAHILHGQTRT